MWKKIKALLNKDLWQDPNYEVTQVSCAPIVYNEVPQDLYDKLLAEAHASGVEFDGNKVKTHGVELDWDYDPISESLAVTCTKKPFYITCEEVEGELNGLLAKARSAA